MAIVWEEWLGSGENWKNSTLAVSLTTRHEHEKIGARRWMTRKQIEDKYGSKEIAQSIIDAKWADPILRATHIKKHPDSDLEDSRSHIYLHCVHVCVYRN